MDAQDLLGPATPIFRKNTVSSLLAKFSPSHTHHKMVAQSSTTDQIWKMAAASHDTNFPHRPKIRPKKPEIIDLVGGEESNQEDEIQYTPKLQRRRALRAKTSKPRLAKSRKLHMVSGVKSFDEDKLAPKFPVTDRVAIRQEIESTTAAKRRRFFIEKKDYFLPLLPDEHNYFTKLMDKEDELTSNPANEKKSAAYEELQTQPLGVTATMKPYQLSGLSFLVYLHRNGLSGILGDEMGLGKTLQTLSLIQYLKEIEPKGSQTRPFLVICPLSVLSSWMAEARKWVPGLKVIRFHGPSKERDRVKKIASGEIDFYGNLTTRQKNKLKGRRTASGKPLIAIDSDSDDEEEPGVDVVVTTYESYQKEQGWFKRAFVWRYVVLDEGHKIK